jgi:XTP/dITP diphosphohydrolase
VSGSRGERDRANNDLLLAQLSDVPDERRTAAFHCSIVLAVPTDHGEPAVHAVDGIMRGRVIRELRGTGGFGYDVLFCADGHDVTTAQLPPGEKDAISHRGKALREIAPVVAAALGA